MSDDLTRSVLPWNWHPEYGLNFPLKIIHGGQEKVFDNYNDYHEFISNLFRSPEGRRIQYSWPNKQPI